MDQANNPEPILRVSSSINRQPPGSSNRYWLTLRVSAGDGGPSILEKVECRDMGDLFATAVESIRDMAGELGLTRPHPGEIRVALFGSIMRKVGNG